MNQYINLISNVPNEQVPKYLIASDIFVLSSLTEGFPLCLAEAMAAGLPIIATNVGGIPDIIKDDENGFLVEPKNPKEIAKKVILVIKDDNLRKKISEKNRIESKKYDWKNIVDNLEKIYLDVISGNDKYV